MPVSLLIINHLKQDNDVFLAKIKLFAGASMLVTGLDQQPIMAICSCDHKGEVLISSWQSESVEQTVPINKNRWFDNNETAY